MSKLVAAFALALGAASLTDEGLRREVNRLVAAVSAARHLPYTGTLRAHAVTREEASRSVLLAVGEGAAGATQRAEGEILKRLGLLPAEADAGGRAAQAYGFAASPRPRYDAASRSLLVPDFIPFEAQRTEVAHEVAHAVADQRFGLRKLLEIAPDGTSRLEGDARRARLALVEGDAMLTGLELADPRETFLGAHELGALAGRLRGSAEEGAPTWFGALGEFTHVDGLLFVARVRAHRPWSAVDALWAEPPASSEQVLHPEKYDACEAPLPVDAAALPALAGFGPPATSDVLGELVVRTWLATAVSPEIAWRAAAGWGGDRVGLYAATPAAANADGGATTTAAPSTAATATAAPTTAATTTTAPLAWITLWDDPAEADDFARAARQVLAKLSNATSGAASGTPAPDDDGDQTVLASPRGAYALARRGDAVALLLGAPEPAPAALQAMLEAVRPRASRRAAPHPRRGAQPGCPRRDRAAGPP